MKTILSLIIGLSCVVTQAQTIEKFSIDSGGASTTNGIITMLYTIGEVNVQELDAGNISLSEGFINSNFDETLSIAELNSTEDKIQLYPNPAQDVFYISSSLPITQLTLYDVSGKQIAKTNAVQMHVGHLSAGMYVVKISTETNDTIKRLVVK